MCFLPCTFQDSRSHKSCFPVCPINEKNRCGPCRYIAPTFEALDKENPDVEFVKVDVDENEAVAALCGISAMPTFQTYKSGSKVSEMRGANVDGLKQMIANSK